MLIVTCFSEEKPSASKKSSNKVERNVDESEAIDGKLLQSPKKAPLRKFLVKVYEAKLNIRLWNSGSQ